MSDTPKKSDDLDSLDLQVAGITSDRPTEYIWYSAKFNKICVMDEYTQPLLLRDQSSFYELFGWIYLGQI